MCLLVNFKKYAYSDVFYEYGHWTLAEEPYSESQQEWEACSA